MLRYQCRHSIMYRFHLAVCIRGYNATLHAAIVGYLVNTRQGQRILVTRCEIKGRLIVLVASPFIKTVNRDNGTRMCNQFTERRFLTNRFCARIYQRPFKLSGFCPVWNNTPLHAFCSCVYFMRNCRNHGTRSNVIAWWKLVFGDNDIKKTDQVIHTYRIMRINSSTHIKHLYR